MQNTTTLCGHSILSSATKLYLNEDYISAKIVTECLWRVVAVHLTSSVIH
jgi:hypothetical protein